MTMQTPRRVALNADVVSYSRLLADDRDSTTSRMEELRHLVGSAIEGFGATLVTFVGDNFMAVFDEAIEGLACAIDLTRAIERQNAEIPGSRQIRFRMGLDIGDVISVDGQYFGDALNIAARIQAMAPPGGLSVSGAVYRELDEPSLRFRPLGLRDLKNIPEAIEIYEFADLPTELSARVKEGGLSLETPTLAVLPVHSETMDAPGRAMAEALRADLIHRLSRIPQLSVIDARSEPEQQSPGHAARYIIETGFVQVGELARVYASLIDVTTMNIVKSHRWSGPVHELFETSETMADEVANAVEIELIIGEPAGLYADLGDPVAIEKIYLGWYYLTSGTSDGWARSLALFGDVAKHHADQPFGHVLAAFSQWLGANYGWSPNPQEAMESAIEYARVGVALGDPTGMGRMVEAAVLMSNGRGQEALEAVEGIDILRPTCDATFGLEGSVRRYLGQWDKSVDLEDRAMGLIAVTKPWYATVKGCSLYLGGRPEEAATVIEQVLEHQPNNLEALLVLAGAQVELGLDRRARATADQVRQRFPGVDVAAWLDSRPFEDKREVERWRTGLTKAGVF